MNHATTAGYRPVGDILLMTGRSIRRSLRQVDNLLAGVFVPVMMMLLLTTVFGGAMSTGEFDYVDYVVPGVLLMCAGFGAAQVTMSITYDIQQGIVSRFRTMNVLPSAVLIGHVFSALLRNLASLALATGVAVLIGFRPEADLLDWLAATGILSFFILALSGLSALFGLLIKSVDAAYVPSFFFLFLPYVSSGFVPVETLPGWLQPVAEHQPMTPLIESVRSFLLGTPLGNNAWIAIAWCTGILVVSAVTTSVVWRRLKR
ncbi:ABC-2 type transport system permease protein [Stackebrandtia endophytica]|uniref:Transport permease protein n=1 Tax=Stackebrandtia endophytica TaxID=1496996 RepID=A0A543B040_9ACTN|nr:ABC transporter permease [Stackebrandtia endophytica]TQL78194.1 ABC-2 type transport system permease protein [Stackebrandtia endophytica]